MAKHDYFTRIEHLNGYVNARPIYEVFGDGLIEVDKESIGPYGTITIAGGINQNGLEDGKYYVFSISDEDFRSLEQTNNGRKIKAKDFTARSVSVEASPIREVVIIPSDYSVENYNLWSNQVFSNIDTPITKNVYLFNNKKIYGPFKYQSRENQGIVFTPNSSIVESGDQNIVKCYEAELLIDSKTLLGIPEYNLERIAFGEYNRYILYLKTLPEKYTEIDCISDTALKSLIGNLLSSEGMTKSQRTELKASINSLPTEKVSDKRKDRILHLVENGELADMAVRLIPTVLTSDESTLQVILNKVFSNRDYINKLYPIIKEQEGFGEQLSRLEQERAEKIQELELLNAEIAENKQLQDAEGKAMSGEDVEKLQTIIQQRDEEITSLRRKQDLNRTEAEMKSKIDELRRSRRDVEREIEQYQGTLKKKVQDGYSSLAIDGTLASMMIEEAAKFEKRRKEEQIKRRVCGDIRFPVNNEVTTPAQLVDF